MQEQTRRRFMVSTAAAVAGLCVSRNVQADQSKKLKGMTLGFSTYGMKVLKTEAALEHIAKIGFDAVEMTVRADWDSAPGNMDAKRRTSIRNQLKDGGLELSSFMEHLYPSDNDAEHAKGLERLKGVIEMAYDLSPDDPPLIQTVFGGRDWEKRKNMFLDRLGDWAELGEKNKIVFAIKPHRGGALSKPSEAVWLIGQLKNTPWVRMVYDYSHYAFRDMPMDDTIKTALPITAHIAAKDTIMKDGRTQFVLPGESGNFDFKSLLQQFHKGGYRGDISCEVSGQVWSQKGYDPIAAAKTCYKNMSAYFQSAGVPRRRLG
ncbi:MAG: hypothetical protein CMJ78_24175 [Planctomycetaceae bacterium]|nr:hypothetical protein [Planctomycetaceae bacterium]